MGTFEIILFSLFLRNIGVYGNEYVSESFVISYFPIRKNFEYFDPDYYEKKLMGTGLFQSVQVEYLGNDTIDVIVAVKEKKRFTYSLNSEVLPTNEIAGGLRLVDRFFLGKMYGMTCDILPFKTYRMNIILENYQYPLSLLIKAGLWDFKDFKGNRIRETSFLMGLLAKINASELIILIGPVIKNENQTNDKAILHLEGDLSTFSRTFKSTFYILSDILSDEYFFSLEWKSLAMIPFKFFFLIPEFRFIFQKGNIPQYRKIIAGGFKTMISYPFGTASGNSGCFFKFSLLYPLLIPDGKKPGIGISWFTEFGKSFDNLKQIMSSKILIGSGVSINTFSLITDNLGLFISYNLDHRIMYGIYFDVH